MTNKELLAWLDEEIAWRQKLKEVIKNDSSGTKPIPYLQALRAMLQGPTDGEDIMKDRETISGGELDVAEWIDLQEWLERFAHAYDASVERYDVSQKLMDESNRAFAAISALIMSPKGNK